MVREFFRLAGDFAPEEMRRSDPSSVTWAYLNGKFATDVGKNHSQMIMEKVRAGTLSASDLSALATAALGRSSSDGMVTAIWGSEAESMGGIYKQAVMAALAAGIAKPEGTIVFPGGSRLPMREWMERTGDAAPTREGLPSQFQEQWYSEPEETQLVAFVRGLFRTAAGPMGPFGQQLLRLRPQMAAAAQQAYDAWTQDADGMDDELGGGGICDQISSEIMSIIGAIGDVEVEEGGQDGDDHSFVMARLGNERYGIDIPPYVYETGGGYNWRKIPGVTFSPAHVEIYQI